MNPNDFLSSALNESIAKNQNSMYTWVKYKDELRTTQNLLGTLPDRLNHSVLVPVGSKAFMPGKIVHTNELLVSLGAGYMAKKTGKQAWEYCARRIQNCDEMLGNLEKELELLTNKMRVPNANDAFGSEERPEIVEHVTEDQDKEWRVQHREREKEYRRRLADMKKEHKEQKIETEQDLWDRLDELELEEELEDELNRLHDGDTDDSEESDKEVAEDNVNEVAAEQTKVPDPIIEPAKRKRSVIFVEEPEIDSEPLVLNFQHSSRNPLPETHSNSITSPSDIHAKYLTDLKNFNPVSILKVKTNPNEMNEVLAASKPTPAPAKAFVPCIGPNAPQPRKVSKFKASRMKKQ